jgi:hypothetical protein
LWSVASFSDSERSVSAEEARAAISCSKKKEQGPPPDEEQALTTAVV